MLSGTWPGNREPPMPGGGVLHRLPWFVVRPEAARLGLLPMPTNACLRGGEANQRRAGFYRANRICRQGLGIMLIVRVLGDASVSPKPTPSRSSSSSTT